MALLSENELGGLLRGFSTSAFRFEIRDRYNSEVGREPFRKFLVGEPDDYEWHRQWMEMIRQDRASGKVWQRVRIVSVPLSAYNRYRDSAVRLGLSPYDAWLFDSEQLVRLRFDDVNDTFRGAEIINDGTVVARHNHWRELAWRHAQEIERFATAYA